MRKSIFVLNYLQTNFYIRSTFIYGGCTLFHMMSNVHSWRKESKIWCNKALYSIKQALRA